MQKIVALIAVITVGLLLTVSPLAAQTSEDKAKLAFEEGTALFSESRFLEASGKFREAYRHKPAWKLLYNIGQSEASAKRYGLALEAFETYLLDGGDEIPVDRQEEIIRETTRLRAFVGMLNIKSEEGAEIHVDGILRGKAPLPGLIAVAARKKHTVRAILDGETIGEQETQVMVGQTGAVDLFFEKPPSDSTPAAAADPGDQTDPVPEETTAAPAPSDNGKPLRTAGWITAGLGAALLIGGSITGKMAMGINGDIEENCPNHVCASEWDDDIDKRDTLGVTTTILLGVGGAALGTGVILLIAGHRRETSASRIAIRPMGGLQLAGATVEWRF